MKNKVFRRRTAHLSLRHVRGITSDGIDFTAVAYGIPVIDLRRFGIMDDGETDCAPRLQKAFGLASIMKKR